MRDSEDRTTAVGLCRYAHEYIAAAQLVASSSPNLPPMPAYHLASHGIELSLKAFLRHRGVSVRALRGPGLSHDLRALYRKSKELGLKQVFKVQAADLRTILVLEPLLEMHVFRYILTGVHQMPTWENMESFAVRLHQAVAVEVGARTFLSVRS
jgi:hypothetical protein